MNLLFLNVGRRCELVDAFRTALVARGGGRIHGSDVSERAPGLYKVDQSHILPHGSLPEFVPALCELCLDNRIDLLIPTIDPDLEFLSEQRSAIEERCPDLRILLSPPDVVAVARDKRLTRDRFARLGAEVPREVDPGDPATEFPIFMKPARGSAGEGARPLRNRAEFETFAGDVPDPMFENLIAGPEYTVDVLCGFDSQALVAIPRKRLKTRGGEVTQGIVERDEALEELSMRLAEGIGCTGPVTLQFRRPPGASDRPAAQFVAMELNARMGGGLPLAIAAGADWPGWILDLCAGKRPNTNVPINDHLLMLRHDASVFVPGRSATRSPAGRGADRFRSARAWVFDMDDTLYPERDFVYSGFRSVAERVHEELGVDIEPVLRRNFDAGLRNDAFGHALRELSLQADEDYIRNLVSTYREHTPDIQLHLGSALLHVLRSAGLKLALLTDGLADVQRRKVISLGIEDVFDAIVYSDELGGREAWKPATAAFVHCLKLLDVDAAAAVYVADNPAKDFRGARKVGMHTIRLRHPSGEHTRAEAASPDDAPDHEVASFEELGELLKLHGDPLRARVSR